MIGKAIAALFFILIMAFAAVGVLAIYLAADSEKNDTE
jgi:hypothetical protein